MAKRLSVILSALILYCALIAPAQAVEVYIQYDQSTIEQHPALVANSGSDFSASANLQSGEFKGLSQGAGNDDQNAYSGSFLPLVLTNNTASPITIAAGDFVAHVQGSYAFGGGANQTSQTTAFLTVSIDGAQRTASGRHIVAVGTLVNPTNSFTRLQETGGASINLISATTGALIMDLVMPELVLNPGQEMEVQWTMNTVVNTGNNGLINNFVESDFFSGDNGLQMMLSLPAGVTLDSDASVPLDWVVPVPVPAAVWLFGSSLMLLGGLHRKSAKRSC